MKLTQKIKTSFSYRLQQRLQEFSYKQLELKWLLQSGLLIRIEHQAEWIIYNDIFVEKEYDLPIEKMIASAQSDRPLRILDLGSNVGFFIVRVLDLILRSNKAHINYQITAIEGSPKVYRILQSRLNELDLLLSDSIRLVNGLVGQKSGIGKLVEFNFHVMNSVSSTQPKKGLEVPYIDISALYQDDEEIDLIKCDIEGSELHFLHNYQDLLLRTKCVVFELHHHQCDTSKCVSLLRDLGFVKQLLRQGSNYTLEYFYK